MAMNQIKTVSNKHEAIADWLITNPGRPLSECAATFHVSQAWLSVIIHSDAFQAHLDAKQDVVFTEVVIPLREKIHGVAHQAVDKLGTMIPLMLEPKDVKDTADLMLKSLGFTGKPQGAAPSGSFTQNNTMILNGAVDKDTLARARAKMAKIQQETALIEQDPTDTIGEENAIEAPSTT